MRYYRIVNRFGDVHLTVETSEGELTSLTSLNEEVSDFCDLLKAEYISGLGVDEIARNILSGGQGENFTLSDLIEWSVSGSGDARIIRPLDPDEMWAGGVGSYSMAPEAVAALPESGRTVYNGERPAILYKGSASRLAGPFDSIGIRSDIDRTTAEGELVVVIYKGRLVAYSMGHEVAGGLMRDSMWWAVPSKVFRGCASLGPCVVTAESLPDPTTLRMDLTITRDGKEVARVSNTTQLRRDPAGMVQWLTAHDAPPDLAIVYTGGCVIAGDTPMQAGDVVRINLEGVGYVENTVELV